MIRTDQHSGREVSLAAYVVVWLLLMTLNAGSFGLSFLTGRGIAQLPVGIAIAIVNLVLILWFFMHLAEEKGTRRFALPVGIGFLLLLLSITLLDVATRFPPANPNAIPKEVQPHRPMPSRTAPPGWQPWRIPGE